MFTITRTITTICLKPELKAKALRAGINLSRALEEALESKLFEYEAHSEAELENKIKQTKLMINQLKFDHERELAKLKSELSVLEEQLKKVIKGRELFNEEQFNKLVDEFKGNISKRLINGLSPELTIEQKRTWQGIFASQSRKRLSIGEIDSLIKEVIREGDGVSLNTT